VNEIFIYILVIQLEFVIHSVGFILK